MAILRWRCSRCNYRLVAEVDVGSGRHTAARLELPEIFSRSETHAAHARRCPGTLEREERPFEVY